MCVCEIAPVSDDVLRHPMIHHGYRHHRHCCVSRRQRSRCRHCCVNRHRTMSCCYCCASRRRTNRCCVSRRRTMSRYRNGCHHRMNRRCRNGCRPTKTGEWLHQTMCHGLLHPMCHG